MYFNTQKFLVLKSTSSNFSCFACDFGVLFKNSLLYETSEAFLYVDSFSSSVYFFGLLVGDFCIQHTVRVQLHSSACAFPVLPAPVVGKTVHSPLTDLDTLVENHLTIYARLLFVLSVKFCWPLCLSICP